MSGGSTPAADAARVGGAAMTHRAIIHLDLDAFYASVEQLRRPELRGLPVIVGGAPSGDGSAQLNRGVVSAASYEARAFGVHSAMPLRTALRLCPQAVLVPVDFRAYRDASKAVFDIARDYTPLIEPLSLDEAFLDVTGSTRRFGSAQHIAEEIRDRILAPPGCMPPSGWRPARRSRRSPRTFASRAGSSSSNPEDEAAFLAPLPLRRLPGLGPAAERALSGLGISTLGQLASLPLDTVQRRVGRASGASLWERAQGIDTAPVSVPGAPRSVSREETFARDVAQRARCTLRVAELASDVGARLRTGGWTARTVTLKLRYSDFTTITRQETLASSTATDTTVRDAAVALLDAAWSGDAVRLLGVGVSGLEDAPQLDLFDRPANDRIDHTLDRLRKRFGQGAIRRGTGEGLHDLDWRGDDLRR